MTALKNMRIRRKIKRRELARQLNATRSSAGRQVKRGMFCLKTTEFSAVLRRRLEELVFPSRGCAIGEIAAIK